MIFAKIDYINLIPFYIYIKKNIKNSQVKAIINYKKSYPSDINKQYKKRQIDAAFISSIVSKNQKSLDLGIVAKGEVLSVLVLKGDYQEDLESSTSNILAKVLNIRGKVIIGDKALKYYHANDKENFVDLAEMWNKKYNLPFVFARLCFNTNEQYLRKITKSFNKRHIKIPQYILEKYAKKTGISKKNILNYLEKIDYIVNGKEKKSLKLFFKLAQKVQHGTF